MPKPRVLIICTGNSMRSQLAEGVLRDELGEHIDVFSAGTHPSSVYPLAIQVLEDAGIDTSKHYSKSVLEFVNTEMDLVITVCDSAQATCPIFPGAKKTIHKGYADPLHHDGTVDPVEIFADLRDRMRRELTPLVINELGLRVS